MTPLYVTDEVCLLRIVRRDLLGADGRREVFSYFQNKWTGTGEVSRTRVKPPGFVAPHLLRVPRGFTGCDTKETFSPIGEGNLSCHVTPDIVWMASASYHGTQYKVTTNDGGPLFPEKTPLNVDFFHYYNGTSSTQLLHREPSVLLQGNLIHWPFSCTGLSHNGIGDLARATQSIS